MGTQPQQRAVVRRPHCHRCSQRDAQCGGACACARARARRGRPSKWRARVLILRSAAAHAGARGRARRGDAQCCGGRRRAPHDLRPPRALELSFGRSRCVGVRGGVRAWGVECTRALARSRQAHVGPRRARMQASACLVVAAPPPRAPQRCRRRAVGGCAHGPAASGVGSAAATPHSHGARRSRFGPVAVRAAEQHGSGEQNDGRHVCWRPSEATAICLAAELVAGVAVGGDRAYRRSERDPREPQQQSQPHRWRQQQQYI